MKSIVRQQVINALCKLTTCALRIREEGLVVYCGEPFERASLRATIDVHDPRFWSKVMLGGAVGAGDGYVSGLWDCDDLSALTRILLRNRHVLNAVDGPLASLHGAALRALATARKNTVDGARRNIRQHYDLGNDFFQLFLDETMTYSSGLFPEGSTDLRAAQEAKYRRLCESLQLRSQDHLLEIGSGWGGLAIFAAKHYGCRVTTTTISDRQFELASERVTCEGLQDRVKVLCSDYRLLTGRYDKLVSVEMLEAVGPDQLQDYFATCARLLDDAGLAAFQMTTMLDAPFRRAGRSPDFIATRVFPGSHVPSFASLYEAISRCGQFRLYDYQELSSHYAVTLGAWRRRFLDAAGRVRRMGFSEQLVRTWDYYLAYCQGAFEERYINCGQLVLAGVRHLGANLPAQQLAALAPPLQRPLRAHG